MGLIEQGITSSGRVEPRIVRAALMTTILVAVIVVAMFAALQSTAGPAQTVGADLRLPSDGSQAYVEAHRGVAAPWVITVVDSYDLVEHNRSSH